jgi:hypothetical protein
MALGVVLVICVIICSFCCLLGGAFAVPPPSEMHSYFDGYKYIASGRTIYDRENAPSNEDESLCKKSCDMDFTCKGFNAWTSGKGIFAQTYCLKQTKTVNPWFTVPAYIMGRNNSNIFIKSS